MKITIRQHKAIVKIVYLLLIGVSEENSQINIKSSFIIFTKLYSLNIDPYETQTQ